MSKPREFWIDEGFNQSFDTWEQVCEDTPEALRDKVIHVIEKSAADELAEANMEFLVWVTGYNLGYNFPNDERFKALIIKTKKVLKEYGGEK